MSNKILSTIADYGSSAAIDVGLAVATGGASIPLTIAGSVAGTYAFNKVGSFVKGLFGKDKSDKSKSDSKSKSKTDADKSSSKSGKSSTVGKVGKVAAATTGAAALTKMFSKTNSKGRSTGSTMKKLTKDLTGNAKNSQASYQAALARAGLNAQEAQIAASK